MSKYPGFELAGQVWVDSGTLMVGDPCYLDGGFDYIEWGQSIDFEKGIYPGPSDFAKPGEGGTFAFGTRWGDGTYPVYVKKDRDGQVTAVLVDTDPDEEEEDF